MEDDFYSTIKLISGEEIFCKVSACDEGDRILLILSNPIMISKIPNRSGMIAYKIEPWLKTTTDDMFILNMTHVMTMTESSDMEMIMMYQNYIRQSDKEKKNETKMTRSMGYISNVRDAKEFLEKLYNL